MRRTFTVVALLVVLTSISFAQAGVKIRTRTAAELAALQRQLVGGYCRADFDGQRLTEEGWAKMKPLLRDNRNPEFAVINIVSRFTFQSSETVSISVPVTYTVVGRYDFGYGYTPASGNFAEVFRAEEKDGELVITDAPAAPYVSKRAMVQWLRSELAQATSDTKKAQMEHAIQALEVNAPAAAPAK